MIEKNDPSRGLIVVTTILLLAIILALAVIGVGHHNGLIP